MDKLSEHVKGPFVQLLLSLADDKFILGHRNADWTGLAPLLEEDIAFSSIAQDEPSDGTQFPVGGGQVSEESNTPPAADPGPGA